MRDCGKNGVGNAKRGYRSGNLMDPYQVRAMQCCGHHSGGVAKIKHWYVGIHGFGCGV